MFHCIVSGVYRLPEIPPVSDFDEKRKAQNVGLTLKGQLITSLSTSWKNAINSVPLSESFASSRFAPSAPASCPGSTIGPSAASVCPAGRLNVLRLGQNRKTRVLSSVGFIWLNSFSGYSIACLLIKNKQNEKYSSFFVFYFKNCRFSSLKEKKALLNKNWLT